MSSTVDCDVIQLLVDNGANMDIEVDGMNLLDFAIENNVDSSIIDYLMSCGLTSMQKNIA